MFSIHQAYPLANSSLTPLFLSQGGGCCGEGFVVGCMVTAVLTFGGCFGFCKWRTVVGFLGKVAVGWLLILGLGCNTGSIGGCFGVWVLLW